MPSTTAPRTPRVMLAALAPTVLLLAACGSPSTEGAGSGASATGETPATIAVATAQGEVDVPQDPETIITFDLATLDTLDRLGVDVAGVPEAPYPDYLSDYAEGDLPRIGSLFEPDYEAVAELDPDLIVVSGRSLEAMPELENIAPTIDLSTDPEDYLASVERNVSTLGEITGESEAAASALDSLETEIAGTRALGEEAGSGLFVMTTGGEVSAYGAGSRFGFVHDVLGIEPASDIDAARHGEPVSFEFIAEADPDWLLVLDRNSAIGQSEGGAAEAILANELVAQTTAWSQDQVVYLDPVSWYITAGGLTAMDTMVSDVRDGLSG